MSNTPDENDDPLSLGAWQIEGVSEDAIAHATKEAERRGLLKSLDFDPGAADGRMGTKTADAIRQFQGISGVPPTGEPSADLLRQLREVTGFQR